MWNNIGVANTLSKGLYDGVRLFSEDLNDAGYQMLFNGKWHVSYYDRPNDRGFTKINPQRKYIKQPLQHTSPSIERWHDYDEFVPRTERNPGDLYREGYPLYTHYGIDENPFNDKGVVDKAIEMLHENADSNKPWCHFIGTIGPHDPYTPPKRFLDLYDIEKIELPISFHDSLRDKPNLYRRTRDRFNELTEEEHKEAILHYLAFCSYEDELFGKIMNALEASGQKDNTLVLFTSDHGDYMGEHGLWCKGLPCFTSAYHIPAVIRWPKGIKERDRLVHDFISITDFAPTFCELAGVKPEGPVHGKSLVDYLSETQPTPVHSAHYTQSNGNELYGIQRSVTTKEWKYVYNGFDYDELYDLKNDPHEMTNLIDDPSHSHELRSLAKSLWSFAKETNDVCINPYILVSLAPFGPGIINE